jgi:hypothetical protein
VTAVAAAAPAQGACPAMRPTTCPAKGPKQGCQRMKQAMGDNCHALEKSIDAAAAAVKAGDSNAALAELAKAKALITQARQCVKQGCSEAAAGTPVNARCPMMGSKIDPEKVPANLRRQFKGQTVGFCCGGCPGAWDKLSDQQKEAKLQAAILR